MHALQGTKQRTLELERKELQGAKFSWLPIITCFQHLSTFLIVLHGSQEEVKTHFSTSTATFLCSTTVGSPRHLLLTALSRTQLHTVPITTGACVRGPLDIHSGKNPQGPALMSNASFLFKSLEVMRRNIQYKKARSCYQDQVTTPERQQCHQNASHIKADAEVYFAHKYTTR